MTSEELRRRREALGVSQYALAKRLGVHRSTVKRWEDGTFRDEAIPPWLDLALSAIEAEKTIGK